MDLLGLHAHIAIVKQNARTTKEVFLFAWMDDMVCEGTEMRETRQEVNQHAD